MTKRAGMVAALVAAVGLGGAPRADAAGRVGVVAVDACQGGTTAGHAHALRDALSKVEGERVLTRDETIRQLGGAPRGTLADAERLLASARFDFLDQSALDRAERTLLTAIEDLRALPASDARWQDLKDAQLLLGYLYVRQNRRDLAEQTVARVLAVDRKVDPSADIFPPSFRSFVEEQRKRVTRASKSTLRVATQPTGRPVIVDGREMGTAPLTVKLPPGRYRIEANFGTGGSVPRFVDLGEAASIELWKDFEGQIYPAQGPCLGTDGTRDGRLSSMVRLAALLGVDELVGVREEEPAPNERFVVATVIDARSGQETREGKLKLQQGQATPAGYVRLADFLRTGEALPPVQASLGGQEVAAEIPPPDGRETTTGTGGRRTDGAVGTDTAATTASAPAAATSVQRSAGSSGLRTGSYVAGGLGLAGIGAGVVFYLQSEESLKELIPLREDDGSYRQDALAQVEQIQARAESQRQLAMILGGVGAASVAAGVVMFILSSDDGAAPQAGTVLPTGNGVLVIF